MSTFMLFALLHGASPTQAPTSPATPSVVTNPDWMRLPSAQDMAKFYPLSAARQEIEGQATISCKVTSQGELAGCSVMSESPEGAGFGVAALGMSTQFRMRPTTLNGVPVDGGTVRIPIRFNLPKGPAGATPAPTLASASRCYALAAARLEADTDPMTSRTAYFMWRIVLEMKFLASSLRPSQVEAKLSEVRRDSLRDDPAVARTEDLSKCDKQLEGVTASFGQMINTIGPGLR